MTLALAALLAFSSPALAGKGQTVAFSKVAKGSGKPVQVATVQRKGKEIIIRCSLHEGGLLACKLAEPGKGGRLAGTAIRKAAKMDGSAHVLVGGKLSGKEVQARVNFTNVPSATWEQLRYATLDFEHEMGVAANSSELEKRFVAEDYDSEMQRAKESSEAEQ